MNWIDDVLRDFGRAMGINSLTLDSDAVAGLSFERRGALFFERTADAVLVYLARRTPPHDSCLLYTSRTGINQPLTVFLSLIHI